MLIAGFQKTSFVDFPGKISSVIFSPGCNMRCWYCHNSHINAGEVTLFDESEILAYLEKRRDVLEGVVISGGEPTLQRDLRDFILRVKAFGYPVKLDTNGTDPSLLSGLINEGLADYVAMDIKAPLDRYKEITGTDDDLSAVRRSITLLMNSGVDYEFRTTFAPCLCPEDMIHLCAEIRGAKRLFIQQYRPVRSDHPVPHPPSVLEDAASIARNWVKQCVIRGV